MSQKPPFLTKLRDDYTDLRNALRYLVAAASDADRNMRDEGGGCLDCGAMIGFDHDDPDCGMAGLQVFAADARRVLAEPRVTPPADDPDKLGRDLIRLAQPIEHPDGSADAAEEGL